MLQYRSMTLLVRELPNADLVASLNVRSRLVGELLAMRGITTAAQALAFVAPEYERDTFDPLLLPDMEKALTRIERAIADNEVIGIWSDYDADGIPGAVLFSDALQKIGYTRHIHYIPHRVKEGFGLNDEGIAELKEKGVSLIITIDCGIANVDAVDTANALGIDVIITDHHLPSPLVPKAYAIVNPKLSGNHYPDDRLCGAGVIWKVSCALLRRNNAPVGYEKWLLDMAGMATIADMVPLLGENRALARYGLVVLRKSKRAGLQALLKKMRVDQRTLSEDDISFSIVPRINAASRMGHPEDALNLLKSTNPLEAASLAAHLDSINNERKGVVAAMVKEVKKRLKERTDLPSVIVIGNPDWKPSLVGLVAQSVAEEYKRPAFVWGREESVMVKGSVRSWGAINIVALMEEAKAVFIESGGHAFSGGFSALPERVHLIEPALVEACRLVSPAEPVPLVADRMLSLSEVTPALLNDLDHLSPFGEGNPKPRFLFEGVEVSEMKQFGKGNDHLELTVASGPRHMKAIAFFKTPEHFMREPREGARIDLLATLERSTWGGGLRLRIIEVV